jgi:DNA-binding NarL/FixJ family response regulator
VADIRVFIADDHPVVRAGLRTFLDLQDGIEVVGEASDGREAVERIRSLKPDVALVDLLMPQFDGIEVIRRAGDATRIVVLTSLADDDKVMPAVEAGAAGYLLKDATPQQLVDAIVAAHAGGTPLHPSAATRVVRASRKPVLTSRETDVLKLIAAGRSNKQIARDLSVSEKTVKTHVSSLLSKLGVADRTQAALYAVREGLA